MPLELIAVFTNFYYSFHLLDLQFYSIVQKLSVCNCACINRSWGKVLLEYFSRVRKKHSLMPFTISIKSLCKLNTFPISLSNRRFNRINFFLCSFTSTFVSTLVIFFLNFMQSFKMKNISPLITSIWTHYCVSAYPSAVVSWGTINCDSRTLSTCKN